MTDDEESRTLGVELGPLADDLEDAEYPMDKDEVVAAFGDHEIGLEEDDTTVREALEPQGEATYESAQEVEQSILNMVGEDAVGREGYSDRGGHTEEADEEDESF
jgi:uncharacterized protein YheU (UPF0270 family)